MWCVARITCLVQIMDSSIIGNHKFHKDCGRDRIKKKQHCLPVGLTAAGLETRFNLMSLL